ncbi:MAG: division/cell wall cluster transcriptional repressor MraZ [Spirochaetia bacterium]|nr:division/cell wall cluster transcriptional repressor MraZ [Spirochaetia bacterium]MCF7946454.1 division/cell wall cluster transcriptional repressor MraZ [Spirochaetia bacterium]
MLGGSFKVSIDDKGRILIPARLKDAVPDDTLIITRGVEKCLWLLVDETWKELSDRIMGNPWSMFDKRSRLLQRRIIAPAQECRIKSGRLTIPASLRESADLTLKSEAMLLGIQNRLELWNMEKYEKYIEESELDFAEASEAIGEDLRNLL